MCPCHAEHVIDQKLLASNCLTERIKLWERFRVDDAERVQRDFFDRCHRYCAGDEVKVFVPQPVAIPDEIVNIYKRSSAPSMPNLTEEDVIVSMW